MAEQAASKVPQVRFKGFEGAWEEKKLGSLGYVAMNKRVFKNQTSETGEIPFYKIGTFGKEPDSFISQKLFNEYKSKFPYPDKGDLLISASGSIGRIVEYSGKDEYFQDSNIVWLQHDGAIENAFLKQFYSFVKWAGLEGSTIKRLYNKNILETRIVLPKKEEQTQIGKYFRELDSLIDLHQRKHDKLVTLKKAMLQKMFPQPGATTPEIRFKGFEGDWVTKELGELSSLITKGTTPLGKSGKGLVNFVKIENINKLTGEIKVTSKISEIEHLSYLKRSQLKAGDILFSIAGTLGRVAVVPETLLPANTNQALAIIRLAGGDVGYITTYLKGRAVDDFVKKNPTVGAQPNLSLEQVENLEVLLPTEREQQKISTYFRTLDALIAKHAIQLQKLQQIKSACLEKMFV